MCHDSSHGFGYGLKISHFPLSTAKPPSTAHCHGTLPTPAAAAATERMLLRRSIPSQGAAAPRPASMCCRQHLEDGRDYETTIWVPRCISVAATELLQLRRSRCCDGVAAATELRSSIYDALTLRVASERCDAQNDETSMQFPPRRFEIQRVVAHGATVLLAIMPPPCPVIYPEVLLVTWCGLLPSCIYDLIYLQLVANNLSQRYKLTS